MKTAAILFLIAISAAALLFHISSADENITEAEVNQNVTDRGFVDGDIVLTRAQQGELERAVNGIFSQALVDDTPVWKWPNGTVNFDMDYRVKSHKATVNAIWAAIYEFQNRTCIRFRQRTSESDYVMFTKSDGCWSYVGRIGGMQEISIGKGCESKGIVIHEIFHALGRYHEQNRPDRDSYVTVHFDNMIEGVELNFKKIPLSSGVTYQGISYDLGSIMHYRVYAFSKNGQPTITPKNTSILWSSLGQRKGFSTKDLQHVITHYNCDPQSGSWSNWSSWSSCSRTCNGGTQTRTRTCNGGTGCQGSNIESRSCNTASCPVPPSWGGWGSWSSCTASCGTGRQSRVRTCQNGGTCPGSSIEFRDCNTNACPQPPTWSSWSSWSSCSATCSRGSRSRSRRCLNGVTCHGESIEVESCNDNVPCLPEWGDWSSCSASCGGGNRTRSRLCNLNDPSQCQTVTEDCNVQDCPGSLSDIRHIGCYYVSSHSTSLHSLEGQTLDLSDDPKRRTRPIYKCKLGALEFGFHAFGIVLGSCISGSNSTSDYITFPGPFCEDGKGGEFFDLKYMDVYSIEDIRSYAIAADQPVHSPPNNDGLNGSPNSSFKFIPSFFLLIFITVFPLVILN